jgi:predicted nucleotidyltransferase/predicted XRE-type DNA-binding protein
MDKPIRNAIGRALLGEMKRRKLSQGQMAALAGCTQPAISALVTGKSKRPSVELLVGIADALGLSLDTLIHGGDGRERKMSIEDRVSALEQALALSADPAGPEAKPLDAYLKILRRQKADLVSKGVQHVAIFGSAAQEQLRPNSDIDVLVTFSPNDFPNVFEFVRLTSFLESLLGRKVDLVEKDSVIAPLRRRIVEEAVSAF